MKRFNDADRPRDTFGALDDRVRILNMRQAVIDNGFVKLLIGRHLFGHESPLFDSMGIVSLANRIREVKRVDDNGPPKPRASQKDTQRPAADIENGSPSQVIACDGFPLFGRFTELLFILRWSDQVIAFQPQ